MALPYHMSREDLETELAALREENAQLKREVRDARAEVVEELGDWLFHHHACHKDRGYAMMAGQEPTCSCGLSKALEPWQSQESKT